MQIIKKRKIHLLTERKYLTIHPEKKLKQKDGSRDNTELTHLMLELWVLQAHHLQQNRD